MSARRALDPRRRSRRRLLLALAIAGSLASTLGATTRYVRPDGGSAAQCTGGANLPYPGSGTGRACAWNGLFQALPPNGPARLAGGDTLLIAPGSYRIGYGAPGAESCDRAGSYDCTPARVPAGKRVGEPTRILGAGWDAGCTSPPELWGAERPWWLLDLSGARYVEIRCLELTDHSACVENHCAGIDPCPGPADRCARDAPPYGDWASEGIHAEGARNVLLADLDVHGLASTGIHAGGLTDWTVERVKIVANGGAGWDGDVGAGSSSSGDLVFRDFEVAWNGCGETWPGNQPTGCWAQQTGGYGDGFGLALSAGRWLFEDSAFHHNTSDGLDLLYLTAGSSVVLRRVAAYANAGNQVKVAGPLTIENALLVGNCGFFARGGWPLMIGGDHCRAVGNTLSLDLRRGTQVAITQATIAGEGDCLAVAECGGPGSGGVPCDGSERVRIRNSIFAGSTDFLQPFERTCLEWFDDDALPHDPFDIDRSLVWNVKEDPCPGASAVCGQSPRLVDAGLDTFDGHLQPGSPALDRGALAEAPATDLVRAPRPQGAGPDLGAYEGTAGGSTCLPSSTALCLHGGRFRVEANWRDYSGRTGRAAAVSFADDSGLFWFFGPDNLELLVKVLDGCPVNQRFWVYAAATTGVELRLAVTDTRSGASHVYTNPMGTAAVPIQDTSALAVCP